MRSSARSHRSLHKVSPRFAAIDKKVGGSLMRIQRDTRFAKDKRPYNENVSMRFIHQDATREAGLGYYLRITAKDVTLGAGVWQPEPPALKRIRDAIVADPSAWKKARDRKAFKEAWTLDGESLKRRAEGL